MSFVEQVHTFVSAKTITVMSNAGIVGGAGTTVFAGFVQQNILGWIGALVGIGGLVLSWWHKREMQRIERGKLDLEWQRYKAEQEE